MTSGRQTTRDVEWLADELARALAYVEFWYEQQLKGLEAAVPSPEPGTPARARVPTQQTPAHLAALRAKADQLLRRARLLGEAADHLLTQDGLPGLPSYVVPADPGAVYSDQAYFELEQAVERAEALAARLGVVVPTWSAVVRPPARAPVAKRVRGLPDETDAHGDELEAESVADPDASGGGSNLFMWGALAMAAVFACLMTVVAGVAIVLLVSDVLGR